MNLDLLPRNYRAVIKAANRLAISENWPLKIPGKFTVEATLGYINHLHKKAREGKLDEVASIKSYISAMEYGYLQNGIKWKVLNDIKVKFALRKLKRDKTIPQTLPKQDYEFTFTDLETLCSRLDPSKLEGVIVGALATTLFWALGRIY